MADLNKAIVVKQLVDSGVRIDLANQYGDAFMEYMNATKNIDEFGVIVKHPRTGNPIENPYLAIRDRALKKLQAMEMVRADFLWEQYA
jgi:phage terminase small subunit